MGCRANSPEWSLVDMLLLRLRVTGQVVVSEAVEDYGVSEDEVREALGFIHLHHSEDVCVRGTLQ